jgi:hypothetical protein
MRSPPTTRRLAAGVVLAAAACFNESTAPTTITNPAATIAALFAADSALDSDAYRALQDLGGVFVAPSAPLPLARVVAALRATPPPSGTVRMLRRPVGDGRLPPGLANSSGRPPVLPDSLLGTTFVWDPDSARYVASSRTGAPANGLRFVLYVTDSLTNQPDTAAEAGSLDIIDLAPAAAAQLRFLVRGVSGAPTFLDYTLSFLADPSAFTVQADGFVSNGASGAQERRLTFTALLTSTATPGGADESVDFAYDLNVPDIVTELHLSSSEDTLADTTVSTLGFRLSRPNETVVMLGADTTTDRGTVENGQFAVAVNGNLYASLTIVDGNAVIRDARGNVVPIDDSDARFEDEIFLALFIGIIYTTQLLAVVLAIPAILLGFSVGLL